MKKTLFCIALFMVAYCKSNISVAQNITLPFLETFDTNTSVSYSDWELNVNNPTTIVHVQPVSAYGIDSGSIMINLWDAGSLTEWIIESPVFENKNIRKKLNLSFDFAAAVRIVGQATLPQDYAEDYLRVYASSDSGTSYDFVDSFLIGENGILNTGGALTDVFNPTDTQWVSIDEIMLPPTTNRVRFEIFRTYNNRNGNMAFLDNVNIDYCFANAPEGDTVQVDSTYVSVADLEIIGGNLRYFLDANLTQEISDTTTLSDSTYYYITQEVNGCESDPLKVLYASGKQAPVSVDPLLSRGINIYPNPAKQFLHIENQNLINNIEIYSITGQKMESIKLNNNKVDINHLPSGMYLLSIDVEGSIIRHKFVKE